MPPSTCMTWPVIQELCSDNRNAAIAAVSAALPTLFIGWRCALAATFSSVESNWAASGVSVKDGAMQLTLILGANSAARATVSPSMAPLELDTKLWKVKPVCTATVENNTMLACSDFFSNGSTCCMAFTAPMTCML